MSATVEVHWLGHAATKLTSLTGKVIVIDPFLTPNLKTPPQYKNLDALGHVDVTRPGRCSSPATRSPSTTGRSPC